MSEFVFLLRSDEENYQNAMGTPERAQKSMEAWIAWVRDLEANTERHFLQKRLVAASH